MHILGIQLQPATQILAAFFVVIILTTPQLIHAQVDGSLTLVPTDEQPAQPIGLTITPATAYLKVSPGNTALHSITLTNDGLRTVRVNPKLVDFISDGQTGQPQLDESTQFPYLDKDKTSFQPLIMQPNQTAQLTLHISVPAGAERAEYPMTVLFQTEPTQDSPMIEPSTKLTGTIGSNLIVLITSEKEPSAQLRISDWQSWPVVDTFGEISVQPIVRNDAYAAGVASGSATIKNWRGQEVAQFQIEPKVVLAESSRQINPLSTDEAISAFSFSSPFLLGPYSVEITLVQPQENGASAHVEQTTIIALPFSILIAIVFALGLWWAYRSFQRSRIPF